MRRSLLTWLAEADALEQSSNFKLPTTLESSYQATRADDLYLSLVGELFSNLHEASPPAEGVLAPSLELATIANALLPFTGSPTPFYGVDPRDATVFAAAGFYLGGYPASACLTARQFAGEWTRDRDRACFELLARPAVTQSDVLASLRRALVDGDLRAINRVREGVKAASEMALMVGPDEWIGARLLECLMERFARTNLRAILPDGASSKWTPFVKSLCDRGIFEFFPSQIEAISKGLLEGIGSSALQMPTGAGKTALCEALLFSHVTSQTDSAAVLLVPLRALAAELRGSLVQRLIEMGVTARCAYAGTVPRGAESDELEETQVLVATPESLSGILSANRGFAKRLSLVICDEGHLLDAPGRGVGLELLLARLKSRRRGSQRVVFMSAIVPNIEEINAWLGGSAESVVRSEYRPALTEFAVLRRSATSSGDTDLAMHPGEQRSYLIPDFLAKRDFVWANRLTGRLNTHPHKSIKAVAVAAARKALPMGAVIIFAANKSGNAGAIGLAEELILQVDRQLPLPVPTDYATRELHGALDYFDTEFGAKWVGTEALRVGAVLHHGDVPQEARDILESLLRRRSVGLGICTSTLAEGVNLPVRTLILYSVRRMTMGGQEDLLTRDIKNLVGRTGRAGASTRGLVVCANEAQWQLVEAAATDSRGEPVHGALLSLLRNVRSALARAGRELDNNLMEQTPWLFGLVDGIDDTLVDLAALEIGEQEFYRMAAAIAEETFAWKGADEPLRELLKKVVALRAQRIIGYRADGRLAWISNTGARVRMVQRAAVGLRASRDSWDDAALPSLASAFDPLMDWAIDQPDCEASVRESLRADPKADFGHLKPLVVSLVQLWLRGQSYRAIAESLDIEVDLVLRTLNHAIGFSLQMVVEQGVSLLAQALHADGQVLSASVSQFPDHLRFGVWTGAGRALADAGVRHRRAFVALGEVWEEHWGGISDRRGLAERALQGLVDDRDEWVSRLGDVVLENTIADLERIIHARHRPQQSR